LIEAACAAAGFVGQRAVKSNNHKTSVKDFAGEAKVIAGVAIAVGLLVKPLPTLAFAGGCVLEEGFRRNQGLFSGR
jgi:hypothetical protein